eukprot:568656-Lingulodinium_polyedra.AAC.1
MARCQLRILRGELWAVLQALRRACLPITVHTDNGTVVRGFARGERWCTASGRPHADVWRQIWFVVRDLGGVGPDLQ